MSLSSFFHFVVVVLLVAAIFTVQLGLVTADTDMIRELRERRPPPLRLSSPVANQHRGMRQPAPPAPVEESPPGPPPPKPVSKYEAEESRKKTGIAKPTSSSSS